MELVFLGSGGGRWVTITQRLRTGGIVLKIKDVQIHIDPGPGALLCAHENKISPLATNAIFVTHCHPDHYNDAEILIEAMTKGMTKVRGIFAGSKSVVEGVEGIGPAVSSYHLSKVEKIFVLEQSKKFSINGDIEVTCLPAYHTDPTNVGLKLYFDRTLVYTSDTEYKDNIAEFYKDADVIVFNVIRPRGERIRGHLCVNDVIKILKEVNPKIAVLNHFGMKMIDERFKEAKRVEKETGVRTISATDGLSLDLSELKIRGQLRF